MKLKIEKGWASMRKVPKDEIPGIPILALNDEAYEKLNSEIKIMGVVMQPKHRFGRRLVRWAAPKLLTPYQVLVRDRADYAPESPYQTSSSSVTKTFEWKIK